MVYKIQDGIEFETRKEWRDYMMKTYYSFHDLLSGEYLKPPNAIQGQMFDIMNCQNCSLSICDLTEQIQIDNCINCHIFIGLSISTVFIRNCINCKIFSCCQQLRISESFSCSFYTFTTSEIHIELSSQLTFGPFQGGYPEHKDHLLQNNFISNDQQQQEQGEGVINLWYQIYDHNAGEVIPGSSNDESTHWRLLKESEYDQPWFPMGECTCVTPITKPRDNITSLQYGQVGQSYGLQQMKQDQVATITKEFNQEPSKFEMQKSSSPSTLKVERVNQLGIESALLVASARAKGIDVSVWLCESPKRKLIPVPDFNSRFISLGLAVGIQEDWETKRELDLATSPASLSSIIAVCGEGFNEAGTPLINVHNFLLLCDESVEKYMSNALKEEREEEPQEMDDYQQKEPTSPPPIQELISIEQVTVEEENEEEESIYPQDDSMNEPELPVRGRDQQSKAKGKRSTSEPADKRKALKTSLPSHSGAAVESTSEFEKLLINVVRHTDLYHNIQVLCLFQLLLIYVAGPPRLS